MSTDIFRQSERSTLRVLVIAEAANPEWPSVPLVGWSHFNALRGVVNAHLVTQIRNKLAIERVGLSSAEFTAIDSEAVAGPIHRIGTILRGGANKGWTTTAALAPLAYWYFEHQVWKVFGSRIRQGEFDLVHRVTPLTPTLPSPLASKCRSAGVPFILGPLNGGVPWPREFDAARRKEREWLSYVRSAYRALPGYHSTRRNASAIIIGSRDTWNQMDLRYRDKCVYIPENAVSMDRFDHVAPRSATRPIRVVFVGRLVPYKGPDMLLEAAVPLIRDGSVRVEFVGDGPLMKELREYAAREGVNSGVAFHGWVTHERVRQHLAEADLFGFPSIREFGGGAVLEAMATGTVPVVVAYGGPAELVTNETGWTVPIGTRDSVVRGFREQLMAAVADPAAIDRKRQLAFERVRTLFTWQVKAQQVLQVYNWVKNTASKPDFGMPLGPRHADPDLCEQAK